MRTRRHDSSRCNRRRHAGYAQQIETGAPRLLADEPISGGTYTGPGSYDLHGIDSSH